MIVFSVHLHKHNHFFHKPKTELLFVWEQCQIETDLWEECGELLSDNHSVYRFLFENEFREEEKTNGK